MDGNGGTVPPPPKFDSRAAANAVYHRIMTGAANFQQMVNFHVVRSATQSDPVARAESLDSAIRAAERMVAEFRRARAVMGTAIPGLPPAPRPVSAPAAFAQPGRVGPERIRPKPI